MHHFAYQNGQLFAEDVNLNELADQIGTPFYCYSHATLIHHYNVLAKALKGMDVTICYSIKANSNIGIVATLAALGSGADIVSEGELRRALTAGIRAEKIVFSGVGKTADEMHAALTAGIAQFNVESLAELELLSELASDMKLTANVALRVNPDIDAGTHEKISTGKAENKFGIAWEDAESVFDRAANLPNIAARGIDIHIGSQIIDLAPFERAFTKVRELLACLRAKGHEIDRLDLGGGLGVPYEQSNDLPPDPEAYANIIRKILGDSGCRLFVEPGRVIAGNAGILVTSVIRTKKGKTKNFVIVDAAMTELMRPALYGAQHDISAVNQRASSEADELIWDIVGPVCETGDVLGLDRKLVEPDAGDRFAIFTAGAYGAVLGSSYNTRLAAPEVMVHGKEVSILRARPAYEDILAQESLPKWLNKD